MLGEALNSSQLTLMILSMITWEVVRRAAKMVFTRVLSFSPDISRELGLSFASTIHAIVASMLSLALVATERRPASLYHRFELSQFTYAISSGFFAWDLLIVVFVEKFDPAFLLHAMSCLLCYVFGQFPFLNYWGVYFLLFEISTPLLHLRKAMLVTGNKQSKWFSRVEVGFALAFFIARIVVGIPMSILVWQDLLDLLNEPHLVHSHFVVYFYLLANTLLCGLNIFWFSTMVRKRLLSSRKEKAY